MPIYEYECEKCGNVEEIVQKVSDQPLESCTSCSGKVHKLISQSSFHLKGGGWYADSYGSSKASSSGTTKKEAQTTKKTSEKTSTTSESK